MEIRVWAQLNIGLDKGDLAGFAGVERIDSIVNARATSELPLVQPDVM
jgi:hypothetical protein